VVVDEVHLVADQSRGAVLEGLLARLRFHKRPKSLCALSAVVANPEALGKWLGIPVVLGDKTDRMVQVEFCCEVAEDGDGTLSEELESTLEEGEQAIVFCRSKAVSQGLTRDLKSLVAEFLTEEDEEALDKLAHAMTEDDDDAQDLLQRLSGGIAFHHAGLSRESRNAVEKAFRDRHLKVIACTPTLAAGVNLPARLVVVRDVFRMEFVRGYPRRVILSTGELLNMLGRAGRPGHVKHGRGVAIVVKDFMDEEELADLQAAILDGKGNPVKSRMPDSFDSLMRFLLATAADRGETTPAHFEKAVKHTLWYHEQPEEITYGRPFKEDIMEDIPKFKDVTRKIRVDGVWSVPDGVAGSIISESKRGAHTYSFDIRFSGVECTCPAKAKWRRKEVCKHLACTIHYLLFSGKVDRETRSRALYAAAHHFRRTLDLGTKIHEAVRLLCLWRLLEPLPDSFRATPLGEVAAGSSLDLLLIRTAHDRIREVEGVPTIKDVAFWVIGDYFADERKRERWFRAVEPWLAEVDLKRIKLPEKFRGDFERGLENLGHLTSLYGEIATSLGKPDVAEVCRLARGCLQYGVAPEIIPLAALRIPQLGRARCRFLHDDRGIRSLDDLAHANPEHLRGPRAPLSLTRQWVDAARAMWERRNEIVAAPEQERDREVDDFLANFKVDQISLYGEHGAMTGAS
jgi:replicative superfamily II helicase